MICRHARIAKTALLGMAAVAIATTAIAPARATPVVTRLVRSAPYYWGGVAFDSVTSNVYELPGYGPGIGGRAGNTFTVYSSIAQFETGAASGSVLSGGDYYKVEGASTAFGVNLASEPPSVALLWFGLVAFVLARIRGFGGRSRRD